MFNVKRKGLWLTQKQNLQEKQTTNVTLAMAASVNSLNLFHIQPSTFTSKHINLVEKGPLFHDHYFCSFVS